MATVLERFKALGLEHNKKILSLTGMHVSAVFLKQDVYEKAYGRMLTTQKEGDEEFKVWDYYPAWTSRMDEIILDFVQNPFTDG